MIMNQNSKRLIGIKAIADYLEMSPRNVYRWEKELGLPLHRLSGAQGHRVYAEVEELESWLAGRVDGGKIIEKPGKSRLPALIGTVSLVSAAIVIVLLIIIGNTSGGRPGSVEATQAAGGPAVLTLREGLVHVLDRAGETLWIYIHAKEGLKDSDLARYSSLRDIDSDGANEVAASSFNPEDNSYHLNLFDHDGQVIWTTGIDEARTFGGVRINNDYYCEDVIFGRTPEGKDVIFAMWRNKSRFLSIISCHNLSGDLICKYLHTGHVMNLILFDLDGDGTEEIFFCGTNNLLNGEAVIVVLPLTGFHGVCPPYRVEPEYVEEAYRLRMYIPDNPTPGNQLAYIRFRPTEYLKEFKPTWAFAVLDNMEASGFNARIDYIGLQLSGEPIFPYFSFDRNLQLEYAFPSAGLIKHFPDLRRMGEIDISLEQYLDALAANVLRWQDGEWVPVEKSNGG